MDLLWVFGHMMDDLRHSLPLQRLLLMLVVVTATATAEAAEVMLACMLVWYVVVLQSVVVNATDEGKRDTVDLKCNDNMRLLSLRQCYAASLRRNASAYFVLVQRITRL